MTWSNQSARKGAVAVVGLGMFMLLVGGCGGKEKPPPPYVVKLEKCLTAAGFVDVGIYPPPSSGFDKDVFWAGQYGDDPVGLEIGDTRGDVDDPDGRFFLYSTVEGARKAEKSWDKNFRVGHLVISPSPDDGELGDRPDKANACKGLATEVAKHEPKNRYND